MVQQKKKKRKKEGTQKEQFFFHITRTGLPLISKLTWPLKLLVPTVLTVFGEKRTEVFLLENNKKTPT